MMFAGVVARVELLWGINSVFGLSEAPTQVMEFLTGC